MGDFKQVLVLRADLGMSEGKKVAQACHASIGAYEKSARKYKRKWKKLGSKKVALKVGSKESLLEIFQNAKDRGLPAYLVKDAGRTEIKSGSPTCCGIGPAKEDEIDSITGSLSML